MSYPDYPHPHAKLFFRPAIWITAEHAAQLLSIPIDTADRLLSHPETYETLKTAMHLAIQDCLKSVLQKMAQSPHVAGHDYSPPSIRVDCAVELPPLPIAHVFTEEL